MKTEVKLDIKAVLERTKDFGKEFQELCIKYGLVPDVATNEETKDVFFVVNVKDFIEEKDIEMNIKK